jgi:hypothetical protein
MGLEDFAGLAGDIFGVGGFDMSGLTDVATRATEAAPSWLDTFGSVAKAALPYAQLGLAGTGIGLGIQGALSAADQAKTQRAATKQQLQAGKSAVSQAGPVAGFGQGQLSRATAGNIPAPVQAQIDQWAAGAKQLAQDQAARSGQGDSTQLKQWLMWIDQQAEAMKAQALQDEIASGLSAEGVAGNLLGVGAGAAGGAGASASNQQQSLEALIMQSNAVLSKLNQGAA